MNNLMVTEQNKTLEIIRNAGKSEHTTKAYVTAIQNTFNAGVSLQDVTQLKAYSLTLSNSTRNRLKAALSLLIRETTLLLKSNANRDNLLDTQVLLMNMEALAETIKAKGNKGSKAHVWLEDGDILKLFETATHLRDKAILILCLGCGLRRDEATRVKFSDIITQGDSHVLNVTGKGEKDRHVEIKSRMYDTLMQWYQVAGDGYILRGINKGGNISSDRLDSSSLYRIVNKLGETIGKPKLAPHDLRRSFAMCLWRHKVDIEIISMLLGHSSIETTRIYLDIKFETTKGATSFIPFG